ncbi:MAG TPA: TatD family hydrolase [Candidatus Binataceae bacterium]|nr:TatD family hydrolase [Candidatus Binataceae bacterium]
MTPLIDTHCHLADPKLRDELDAILERAAHAGVDWIVSVGAIDSIETDQRTVEIAELHPHIFASVGTHPHDARDCDSERIARLRDLAGSKKVVALGEMGLDFHYMHSTVEAQRRALRSQLELAAELNLPVVIHCRDRESKDDHDSAQVPSAWRILFETIREVGVPRAAGVAHCFTGDEAAAADLLAIGFYISFSGIVTFKTAGALREVARTIPGDRILIETDAPYLAPEPHRGRRNEPAYVRLTLDALAKVRDVAPDQLSADILANARRLFRLPED